MTVVVPRTKSGYLLGSLESPRVLDASSSRCMSVMACESENPRGVPLERAEPGNQQERLRINSKLDVTKIDEPIGEYLADTKRDERWRQASLQRCRDLETAFGSENPQ